MPKILISSHYFHPSIGGIEGVSDLLAHEFLKHGHEVKLITQTPDESETTFPFEVVRKPGPVELIRCIRWCDLYIHNHISTMTAWPLLFIRKPWVVIHQSWLGDQGASTVEWRSFLKRFLLRFAFSVSISRSVADALKRPSIVIPNPYRDDLFFNDHLPRTVDLVFVGRLVSDKGVETLLEALALLKEGKPSGLTPGLRLIGSGPEEFRLVRRARDLGIASQVRFLGVKTGRELAELLNECRIMVVPSLWPEPLGIVALEGIACGCIVVGSDKGGLPEAIGPCGVTFPNGDAYALARRLAHLLTNEEHIHRGRAHADPHLHRFKRKAVVEAYCRCIDTILKGRLHGN